MNLINACALALASVAISGAALADAVVLSLRGTAVAWAEKEPRRPLRAGESVREGEYVATSGADSSLTLRFSDRTSLSLRGDSTLRVKSPCLADDPACSAKSIVGFAKGSNRFESGRGETQETRPSGFAVSQASATPRAEKASCQDPMHDASRFVVTALEVADSKTGLVWFRCPAMWVGKSGGCDPSMVLPSETWAGAMEILPSAPKRRSAWRLASVEELDTIASTGCGYLLNPKYIEITFETVWTRSEASGGKVWQYGVDRARIESDRKPAPSGWAQSIYLRDGP